MIFGPRFSCSLRLKVIMSVAVLFTVELRETHEFIMNGSAFSEENSVTISRKENFLVSSPTAYIATRHNLLSR